MPLFNFNLYSLYTFNCSPNMHGSRVKSNLRNLEYFVDSWGHFLAGSGHFMNLNYYFTFRNTCNEKHW